MKTAVYLRISSQDQNLDGQLAEVAAWLASHGLAEADVTWYKDTETGRTLNRPGFVALQNAIAAGKVDTVIVQRLDRISRKLREGLNCIADWAEQGVRIVAVKQQIDLSGAVGRLVAAVLLGVAEMEWEMRKERQAAGIAAAKKADERLPRDKRTYKGGIKKIGHRKAEPARARELRNRGLTLKEIAAAMRLSEMTVVRYLRETKS